MRIARASSLLRLQRRGICSSTQITWQPARFNGAWIAVQAVLPDFEESLASTMDEIRADGRSGIFMRVPIEHSAAITVAHKHGFAYHHAEHDHAMLLNWLPDEPCPVPPFATHIVGVGGLVVNKDDQVLCVREANSATGVAQWKLPGGLIDLDEEIGDAATREVFEETGIHATFKSIVAMRHQHGAAWGRGDIYIVCAMDPVTSDISVDENEIQECAWLPMRDYVESTVSQAVQRKVPDTMNSFFMRSVAAKVDGGVDKWGWVETELPTAQQLRGNKQITGLTSKNQYKLYHPGCFIPCMD